MKFNTLQIENFLTIKEATVRLDDRGLNLIQGVNSDDSSASSNGAGKSSIVDALCWCLYGVTARDVKGDAVVNLAAKKNCMVSLIISNGTEEYRIKRHRKHGEGKNSLIVEQKSKDPAEIPLDLSKGTDAETQKVVEKILGCSYEVFVAAVYSGQEIMPDLPKMKDKELKTLIEEAAGLQRIEKAYEVAREVMNISKADVVRARDIEASTSTELDRANLAAEDIREKQAEWNDGRSRRVMETERLIHDKKAEICLVQGKIDACMVEKPTLEGDIAHANSALADFRALDAAAIAAEKAVRSAELSVDTGLLKRLSAEIKKYEERIANASIEIKKPCEACGTILETMSIEDFIDHNEAHKTRLMDELVEAKKVATLKVQEILVLREAAVQAREAVPDVSAISEEIKVKKARLEEIAAIEREERRLVADRIALGEQLVARTSEVNPFDSMLATQETRIAEISGRLGAAKTRVGNSEAKFEVDTAVVKVFGPAGVRAQILDTVTPFLNAQTADYLSALSDGEINAVWTTLTKDSKGDLKEKFSLDVKHQKGGDSFSALSGGEKRKVRLATALALQDLVASRATQPLSIWIGDEIDDALDSAGLERLMTILERKARERGTVIVISHSDLRDWIDNVTTVTKTEQWTSVVEGALCS